MCFGSSFCSFALTMMLYRNDKIYLVYQTQWYSWLWRWNNICNAVNCLYLAEGRLQWLCFVTKKENLSLKCLKFVWHDEIIGAPSTLENWRCTNTGFAMKNWERARMKAQQQLNMHRVTLCYIQMMIRQDRRACLF